MLRALETAGQLDRTLVIFSSDNGFLVHEHGLYDKRAMYEESIRIPLLMRYPALIRRGDVHDLTLNVDLAPTLLDLIDAQGAERMQGVSLLPALQGQRRKKRSIFFYQYRSRDALFDPLTHRCADRGLEAGAIRRGWPGARAVQLEEGPVRDAQPVRVTVREEAEGAIGTGLEPPRPPRKNPPPDLVVQPFRAASAKGSALRLLTT